MSSIDERVVNMQFNNRQFQSGITDTLGSLDKLKAGLNLSGAAKGLDGITASAKAVSLSGLASAVDGLSSKFSALSVAGITALATIANKAVNVGLTMAKSLTTQPIGKGFAEYEQGLTAFQTILANTKTGGATVKDVNKTLDTLNIYANKTIYSFGDMTKAMGLFTAQGVNLGDSVKGIKGIYNLISLTGGDADKANSAIYQLSQAIASGTVRAQDWISVVNAGIGGKDFQNQLKQTARTHGVAVDAIIKKEGSFKDSLTKGWLSSDILLETLQQYTGDLGDKQLKTMGYTAKQIAQIQDLGKTANNSATNIKSFTQLMDTLTSNVVTSWATSFKAIFGDLDQASKMWTSVGNAIGGILQNSADARNQLLKDWSKGGGRSALLDGFANGFKALMSVIKPITDAFHHIFPTATAKQLISITVAFRDFMKGLILSKDSAEKLKKTFLGVFAIFDIGWQIVKGITKFFFSLFSILGSGVGNVLSVTAVIGKFLERIQELSHDPSHGIEVFFDKLIAGRDKVLKPLVSFIGLVIDAFATLFSGDVTGFTDELGSAFSGLKSIFEGLRTNLSNMISNISGGTSVITTFLASLGITALNPIINALNTISSKFESIRSSATNLVPNFNLASFKSLGGAGKSASVDISALSVVGEKVKSIWDGLVSAFQNVGNGISNFFRPLSEFFSTLMDKINGYIKGMSFSEGVSLLNTGTFIALYLMLRSFIKSIRGLIQDWRNLVKSIKGVFDQLGRSLKAFQMDIKANVILKIAIAVGILVAAVYVLSKIPVNDLKKAMVALSVMFVELGLILVAFSKINTGKSSLRKTAFGLILLAIAVDILANAVKKLASLNMEELKKGLIGVGGLLIALTLFAKFSAADKGGIKQGVGLVLLALAIKLLVDSVSTLGNMDTGVLIKGIIALGVMLALLVGVVKMFNNTKGVLSAAAGMLILSAALLILKFAVLGYASINPEVFAKGISRIAIALAGIAVAMRLMPRHLKEIAGSLVTVAAALLVLAGVLKIMGSMNGDEIARSLGTLAGSLTIITTAILALSKIRGGAKAVWELMSVAKALVILAGVLLVLSKLTGDELKIGLLAMSGIFGVLVVAGWALKPVVPTLILFAGAVKLLGIAALLAGAGMMLFSGALAMLAVSGAVGFAVLTAGIMGLLPLIPLIAEQVGHGIVAMAKVLGDAVPTLIVAFTKILVGIIKSIVIVGPKAIAAFVTLIISLIDNIIRLIPKFVELGWKLILGLQKGISDHIQEFVVNGLKIISEFYKGLRKGLPEILKAGVDLIVAFTDGLRQNMPRLAKSGKEFIVAYLKSIKDNLPDILKAGKDVIVAWLKGMSNNLPDILLASKNLIVSYLTGLKNNLPDIMKAGKDLMVAYLTGLKDNLPDILRAGTDVIVAFLYGLVSSIPRITIAALAVIVAFVNILAQPENLQQLVSSGINLLLSVIAGIATKIPDIIAAGYNIITKVLEGLGNAEKLAELATAGTKLITNTLDAFATEENLTKIRDAAVGLITRLATSFGEGGIELTNALSGVLADMLHNLASSIRTNGDKISDGIADVGSAIVEGLAKGLTLGPRILFKAGQNLVNQVKDDINGPKGFDSGSPSKVFVGFGTNLVESLALGMDKTRLSSDSASNLGHSAIEAMRKSISGMSDLIDGDIDMRPSITPILDLTDIQKNAGLLGGMLQTDPIAVGATYSKAQDASAGYNANPSDSVQMRRDLQSLTAMVASNTVTTKEQPLPRPMEFHIGVMEDGDSLFRRARATNKMLTLAEGGDSTQIASVL